MAWFYLLRGTGVVVHRQSSDLEAAGVWLAGTSGSDVRYATSKPETTSQP